MNIKHIYTIVLPRDEVTSSILVSGSIAIQKSPGNGGFLVRDPISCPHSSTVVKSSHAQPNRYA